ncbi:LuxR C-terminal-related transcriptional regulator [Candidatus Enterococcus willemsii]|uniref:HTH luxR-type domain-containing protein n=1 Tax=Candidatus Enterococcus willemsii TaxID=1857215 RepID=A0ABQ6YWY1_9ENTE|nr:LuxR C-terminal-related transcriptional regulator [Enterococcus sp. CU12B]KAF1302199.1 hypothetical protein BAU17_02150 [Enterococcus sp. CU12B]
MSNIHQLPALNLSRLTAQEQAVLSAVLEQDISGKSNKEISNELGISESTFYRIKSRPSVSQEILTASKTKADLLLPLAIQKAEKMLQDESTPASAAVNLIKVIYQQAGMIKPPETTGGFDNSNPREKTIDELMKHYGITDSSSEEIA